MALLFDNKSRTVQVNGSMVKLTPREFDLLHYLLKNPNVALTRTQILNAVWESGYLSDTRTVDTHIKCLRAKLGPYGCYITTLRKYGYRLDAPLERGCHQDEKLEETDGPFASAGGTVRLTGTRGESTR